MTEYNDQIIKVLWSNILKTYDELYPNYTSNLNPSATPDDFSPIEEKMGLTLPDELKEWYYCNNGDMENLQGSILGLRFLPLNELFLNWTDWLYIIRDKKFMKSVESSSESYPEGAIKKAYANRKWIPFSHDLNGNHIGIDLDPDTDGVFGQVINFGSDEDKKYVIANNIKEFLVLINKILSNTKPIIKSKYRRITVKFDTELEPTRMIIHELGIT